MKGRPSAAIARTVKVMVTLAGVHGDVPGTTEDEVLAFARSLLSPAVAQLVEHAGPLSSVASYRFPSSQRRHYEKVRGCCRGSSRSATRRAASTPSTGRAWRAPPCRPTRSATTVREVGVRSDELPRRFHRRAAKIIDAPWAIAVGADFLHPKTVGPKARGTDLVNRYVLRVVRASHTSVQLARSFNLVLNLVEPTSSLARPSVVARVLASSMPGRRRQTRVGHPRVGPPSRRLVDHEATARVLRSGAMDDLAADLQHYLQESRDSLLRALDDLSEYDARRPVTPSGTNLLGLVKHLVGIEASYLGDCLGSVRRRSGCPGWTTAPSGTRRSMWATADQSRGLTSWTSTAPPGRTATPRSRSCRSKRFGHRLPLA